MLVKSALFTDSSSDNTDRSDEALDADDVDDDDADDDDELDLVLFSTLLVRNLILSGLFFKIISWVLLFGIDVDVVTEVNSFLLCHERICRRSLPREPLPEFDIVINFKKSLLIKIYL